MPDPQLKFGRKPPKNAPALLFKDIRTAVAPPHPASLDYLALLKDWQMLGNDVHGDCVAVTGANVVRLVSATLGVEYYPTQDEVYNLYKTENPAFPWQDNGMDIQTCLEYMHSTGWAGRYVIAFAKVDVTNPEEMRAAIAAFGFVWAGVFVQESNIAQFKAGAPWDYTEGEQNVGGHSIPLGGFDENNPQAAADFVSWAAECRFTEKFRANQLEEAWVVILPEHLGTKAFEEGVDLSKLQQYYEQITGDPLIIPNPIPVPPPVPPPTPSIWDLIIALLQKLLGG